MIKFVTLLFIIQCIQQSLSLQTENNSEYESEHTDEIKKGFIGLIIILCTIGLVIISLIVVSVIICIKKYGMKQKSIFIRLDSNYHFTLE